ncbi:hypothetical protein V1478_009388 [Vespula squamosa]|uniref:Uncharacterized protein n=1 Tax=Vespula squamosa TaxID=30214 RepID=A0ABD2AS87_VESSQ
MLRSCKLAIRYHRDFLESAENIDFSKKVDFFGHRTGDALCGSFVPHVSSSGLNGPVSKNPVSPTQSRPWSRSNFHREPFPFSKTNELSSSSQFNSKIILESSLRYVENTA